MLNSLIKAGSAESIVAFATAGVKSDGVIVIVVKTVLSILIGFVAIGLLYSYSIDPIKSTLTSCRKGDSLLHDSSPIPAQEQVQSNDSSMATATPRAIRMAFLALEVSEGAGARVRRSVGTPKLRHFSPFLMLDHFTVSKGAGFPDHPHRGQETITYLQSGCIDHEDFAGNKGTLYPGDLQFMTAGRGIMHAEMPRIGEDGTPPVGMQLWVDLPEALKSCEPRYRDLRAKEIPEAQADDGKVIVKVISGKSYGVDSVRDLAYTPVWFLDVTMKPGGKLVQEIPKGWNAFAYTWEGTTSFGEEKESTGAQSSTSLNAPSSKKTVAKFYNVVFQQEGDIVIASNSAEATEDSRFILVAGQPLDQRVVQYGPFVVTSEEAIYQTMMDFQTSTNGFERARNWSSEIGNRK